MDYFLHLKKGEDSEIFSEGSDDSEENKNDIEDLLYSVVHHNDLTQSLPSELEQYYSIEQSNEGELIVSLKEPPDTLIKKLEHKEEYSFTINKKNMSPRDCPKDSDNISKNLIVDNNVVLDNIKSNSVNVQNDSSLSEFKYHRYSEVMLEDNNHVSVTNNTSGSNSVIVDNKIDWKQNSTLDFIPIENKVDINIDSFQKIFAKLSHRYPLITDIKLHQILLKISQLIKNPKHFTFKRIMKKYYFYFRDKKEKRKNVESKLQQNNKNDIEVINIECIDTDDKPRTAETTNSGHKLQKDTYNYRENIWRIVDSWLAKNPHLTAKRINKKLRRIGYRYPLKLIKANLRSRIGNNRNPKLIKNPFNNKIESKESPMVLNIAQCRDVDIPVITIGSSDEESERIAIPTNTEPINLLPTHPEKWTKSMIKFYDKTSKRLEAFDHQKIKLKLRKNSSPYDWRVGDDDYTKQCKNANDERKMKCTNCLQYGHGAFTCKRQKRNSVCFVCGLNGHRVYSCPQKKCLNCDSPSRSYCSMCNKCLDVSYHKVSCEICGRMNHLTNDCTDLWRRFHNTITDGPIVNTTQTPNANKCCSNCSKRGHFAHECHEQDSRVNICSPFVTNYNPLPLISDYRDILISTELHDKLQTPQGEEFLQCLSNDFQSRIDIMMSDESLGHSLRCYGTPEEWRNIRTKLMEWNTLNGSNKKKKRKRKTNDVISVEDVSSSSPSQTDRQIVCYKDL